jgi:hypothetical protein
MLDLLRGPRKQGGVKMARGVESINIDQDYLG